MTSAFPTANDDDAPVVVGCRRTAVGLADPLHGVFRRTRGDELAAAALAGAVAASTVDPASIGEVVLGCLPHPGAPGGNPARVAALLAGLPFTTAAATVNRGGGSGLEAVARAAHAVRAGAEQAVIAAGVDQFVPPTAPDVPPRALAGSSRGVLVTGLCAEHLATREGIDRERQEGWALESRRRAAAAAAAGWFAAEIVPVGGHDEAGNPVVITVDQPPGLATARARARPEPTILPGVGTITTAATAPPGAGAAAVVVMSRREALRRELRPLVRIVASAVVGVPPAAMAGAAVAAARKLLHATGLVPGDLDQVEFDESFAALVLHGIDALGLDPARVNPAGGSLALGHTPAAAGVRGVTALVHGLLRGGGRLGLAAATVELGQGIALLVEREPA